MDSIEISKKETETTVGVNLPLEIVSRVGVPMAIPVEDRGPLTTLDPAVVVRVGAVVAITACGKVGVVIEVAELIGSMFSAIFVKVFCLSSETY